jgi:hypothetical protein
MQSVESVAEILCRNPRWLYPIILSAYGGNVQWIIMSIAQTL